MSPLAFHNFRTTKTTLDLNGPLLSFSQEPAAATATLSGIATFVGIASAVFTGVTTEGSGTINYRWYEGETALSDGTNISGSGTTTLTVSNLQSPDDNAREFFLRVTYTPSAYDSGKTGNAANAPLDSDAVGVTVFPTISFTTQPTEQTAAVDETAQFIAIPTLSDSSYGPITQEWTRDGSTLSDQADPVISGSGTTTLTIEQDAVGVTTIQSIAYVDTDGGRVQANSSVVNYTGVNPRNRIKIEGFDSNNNYAEGILDLDTAPQTIDSDTLGSDYSILTFHALEKDMNVKMTMAASAGGSSVVYSSTDSTVVLYTAHVGGQGGTSVITTTLEEDVEYTLIGISNNSSIFLYRGSNLILVIGQGGEAGTEGAGGDGGGANVDGEQGEGRRSGSGGTAPVIGTLGLNGTFGSILFNSDIDLQIGDSRASAPGGGETISCSKGSYWINQGISACSDNSSSKIKFVNIDGTEISESDAIIRGFKPGYTISNTAGVGINFGGDGGNGARGGSGGTSGSGGGGGSGYSDGSVTIVETNLGGNTTLKSSITLELV